MGEAEDQVFVTGCPSIDLAANVLVRRDDSGLIESTHRHLSYGVGAKLDPEQDYIICMQHPVTYEWDQAHLHVTETLEAIREIGAQCYWFWPNVDAGADLTSKAIRTFRETGQIPNVHFLKNMPPDEFLYLLSKSKCIVGNSSTGLREAAFLSVPAVNIGSRQKGRERGRSVVDVGYCRKEIAKAIKHQIGRDYDSDPIYGDGRSGPRIAHRLATVELRTEKRIVY